MSGMKVPEFKRPVYVYKAKVVKIVDGDTLDVLCDIGFKTQVFKRIRLLGIDTWEVRGSEREKGLIAKKFVEEKMAEVDYNVIIQTEMDDVGKYGRVLAWVWTDTNIGVSCLNEQLLEGGHGVIPNY